MHLIGGMKALEESLTHSWGVLTCLLPSGAPCKLIRSPTSELKKDWNDNLAAIFEAKLKAAMKAKPPKYDLFSKVFFDPLTLCFRAS